MSVQVVRVGLRNAAVAVPVGSGGAGGPVTVGSRPSLGQLADVAGTATAPVDVPLVLRKGADGVFRPEPAPAVAAGWGDQIRLRPHGPDDPAAPEGAVHINTTNGRAYRHREES